MLHNWNRVKRVALAAMLVLLASGPAAFAGATLNPKGVAQVIPGRPSAAGIVRYVRSTNPLVVVETFYEGDACYSRLLPTRPDWKQSCGPVLLEDSDFERAGLGLVAPNDGSAVGSRSAQSGPFGRR